MFSIRLDFSIPTLLQAIAQSSPLQASLPCLFFWISHFKKPELSQLDYFPIGFLYWSISALWPELILSFFISLLCCQMPALGRHPGNVCRRQAGTMGGGRVEEPGHGGSSHSGTCWQCDLRQIPSPVSACFHICKKLLYFPLLQLSQAYH